MVTALLGLLLAIAMVVVPKLRHRAVVVPAGPIGIPAPKREMTNRAFRAQVPPMDSAMAPMAADAFSRMANDADHTPEPQNHPRAENGAGDRGDTD